MSESRLTITSDRYVSGEKASPPSASLDNISRCVLFLSALCGVRHLHYRSIRCHDGNYEVLRNAFHCSYS
jgi:hypothetical protein